MNCWQNSEQDPTEQVVSINRNEISANMVSGIDDTMSLCWGACCAEGGSGGSKNPP